MKATAKDLRFHTKELLETANRGEEVLITYHGKPYAKLVPLETKKKKIETENELFGIWKDHEKTKNVEDYVRELRNWPYQNNENRQCVQQVVLELKIRYGSLEKTIENGLEKTRQYMDKCGTAEGYLLIFNRSKKAPWKEKIFKKEKAFKGTVITVYGM